MSFPYFDCIAVITTDVSVEGVEVESHARDLWLKLAPALQEVTKLIPQLAIISANDRLSMFSRAKLAYVAPKSVQIMQVKIPTSGQLTPRNLDRVHEALGFIDENVVVEHVPLILVSPSMACAIAHAIAFRYWDKRFNPDAMLLEPFTGWVFDIRKGDIIPIPKTMPEEVQT